MPEPVYLSWTDTKCACGHFHGAAPKQDGTLAVEQVCFASGCECRVYDTEGEP